MGIFLPAHFLGRRMAVRISSGLSTVMRVMSALGPTKNLSAETVRSPLELRMTNCASSAVSAAAVSDGETATQDFEIRMNPRAVAEGVTLADLQERFDFTIQIRDRVTEAHEAVLRIRSIKDQVDERLQESDNSELASLGTTSFRWR